MERVKDHIKIDQAKSEPEWRCATATFEATHIDKILPAPASQPRIKLNCDQDTFD